MGFDLKYRDHGIWCGVFSHICPDLFQHGVSTRLGGASKGAFYALNLALHNGDTESDVYENRQRFCKALGIDFQKVVTAQQVHGDRVVCVDLASAGRGLYSYEKALEDTDALITNVPELPLMLFFADCVPVLFADPEHRAVGICHAGWRGSVAKIAQKTIRMMMQCFGTDPAQVRVGIGPSIGPCCYEVDGPVEKQFRQAFGERSNEILQSKGLDKWKLNLWYANQLQLEEIGVLRDHIELSHVCTSCNADLFFSYRFDRGNTGRIAAAISVKSF